MNKERSEREAKPCNKVLHLQCSRPSFLGVYSFKEKAYPLIRVKGAFSIVIAPTRSRYGRNAVRNMWQNIHLGLMEDLEKSLRRSNGDSSAPLGLSTQFAGPMTQE